MSDVRAVVRGLSREQLEDLAVTARMDQGAFASMQWSLPQELVRVGTCVHCGGHALGGPCPRPSANVNNCTAAERTESGTEAALEAYRDLMRRAAEEEYTDCDEAAQVMEQMAAALEEVPRG